MGGRSSEAEEHFQRMSGELLRVGIVAQKQEMSTELQRANGQHAFEIEKRMRGDLSLWR